MLKFIAKIFVFVSILSAFNQAIAGRVDALYDVEILVTDESVVTREQAFRQGLDEVFVRISGDSIVMSKLKRPLASRYVKQFSYEPVETPTPNEDGEMLVHRLKIHYNGSSMEKYLLDNGFAAWGEYRPDVVVWLVVRDGRNEYVLKETDQSLLKTAAVDAMSRRGIPNRWPLYDQKDKKILSVSDIRGGFKEPVIKASQRYSRGPALTGSMIWNGKRWQSNWSLLMEGENRHWNLDDVDHNQLINKSIDQAADALGMVFAVRTSDNKQQLATVRLDVQAVNTIENYRYVENYLAGLSAVDKVKPFKVDGTNAVFEVLLRSNKDDFLNLIKNDAELTEVERPEVEQPGVDRPEIETQEVDTSTIQASEIKLQDTREIKLSGVTEKGDVGNATSGQAVATKPDDQPPSEKTQVYYYRLNQ